MPAIALEQYVHVCRRLMVGLKQCQCPRPVVCWQAHDEGALRKHL